MELKKQPNMRYFLAGKKRPFATSTTGELWLMEISCQQCNGDIKSMINDLEYYDNITKILQTYLDNGYGTCVNPYEEKVVFINTGEKLKTIVTCRLPDETVNRIF